MIDLIVYDQEFNAQGIVDVQSSVMWERRFYEAGYFEIHTPATENNNALLQQGNYIMRTDAYESGTIMYLHASTAADGSTDIAAIGRFLSWLLHGHIVQNTTTYSGNAETVMRDLVQATVMNSETVDYIPNLELGELCRTEKTVSVRLEYPDLHDALKEIARRSGVGFRLILDPNDGKLYFECFDSHDYSAEQSDNPRVIFSPDYDTIIGSASYTVNDGATVNCVTVVYSGAFGTTSIRYNPNNVSGTDMRELCVVTDKCVTYSNEGGTYLNVAATQALLRSMAPDYISEKKTEVEASAAYTGSFVYKEDYDIGDIVTVEYKPYGITLTQRIHGICENYTESGKDIIPIMGPIWPKGEEL